MEPVRRLGQKARGREVTEGSIGIDAKKRLEKYILVVKHICQWIDWMLNVEEKEKHGESWMFAFEAIPNSAVDNK